MKTTNLLLSILSLLMIGCEKESKKKEEEVKNSCGATLSQIVPQAYLEEVKKKGFPVHLGNTPPDISGTYRFAPWRFDFEKKGNQHSTPESVSEDGFTCVFTNQSPASIDVAYQGYYEGFENCKPFIMGSGNNFTVCRYVGMDDCGANFRYNYMQMISGTKEGNVLKNIKMVTICLKAVSSAATCNLDGDFDIYSDTDGVSAMK